MKILRYILLLPMIVLALVGCSDDDDIYGGKSNFIVAEKAGRTPADSILLVMTYDISKGVMFDFEASSDWMIPNDNGKLIFSQKSGKAGLNRIQVSAKEYNCSNNDNYYHFTLKSTTNERLQANVVVCHRPVFKIENTYNEIGAEGGTVHLKVRTSALAEGYVYVCSEAEDPFVDMWDQYNSNGAKGMAPSDDRLMEIIAPVATRSASDVYGEERILDFVIKPNLTSRLRNGYFCLQVGKSGKMFSDMIQVVQEPSGKCVSNDMKTNEGKVTQLLKHSKGNGVPIVIVGDGFLDTDIVDGTYRNASEKAIRTLFSLHPMANLKEYFDVYEVAAVSYNNYFSSSSKTAFNCKFAGGSSTMITGDIDKVLEYADKAVGSDNRNNVTAIVLINDERYAGTAHLMFGKRGDTPDGASVVYVPLGDPDDSSDFEKTLNHEAIGHGFAKLGDEYFYDYMGAVTNSCLSCFTEEKAHGYHYNLTTETDVKNTPWANFAADGNYAFENLGCYEGGYTFTKGIYRPTENSIMKDNVMYFNAPSRMAIYMRCMKTAFSSSWKFDYSEFLKFDLELAKESYSNITRGMSAGNKVQHRKPLASPVIYRNWGY